MFQALEKLQGISYHNFVLHTCKYSILQQNTQNNFIQI